MITLSCSVLQEVTNHRSNINLILWRVSFDAISYDDLYIVRDQLSSSSTRRRVIGNTTISLRRQLFSYSFDTDITGIVSRASMIWWAAGS